VNQSISIYNYKVNQSISIYNYKVNQKLIFPPSNFELNWYYKKWKFNIVKKFKHFTNNASQLNEKDEEK
jgi:hypothetical protein